jgi:hypothetical protein
MAESLHVGRLNAVFCLGNEIPLLLSQRRAIIETKLSIQIPRLGAKETWSQPDFEACLHLAAQTSSVAGNAIDAAQDASVVVDPHQLSSATDCMQGLIDKLMAEAQNGPWGFCDALALALR